MMKNIWLMIVVQIFFFTACSKSEDVKHPAPEFISSIPEDNATNVERTANIEVVFDEVISLAPNHKIMINNTFADVKASLTKLIFTAELAYNTSYSITIPEGAVINTFNVPLNDEIQFSFTTEKENEAISSPMEFVSNMGVGWNLGNTLDAKGVDETVWGNPKATKALIDAVRAKGFKTLRIPVTWQYHIGAAPDYTIEKEWLDRVEQVVNYGLDNGMIVIVNIHHDEEWIVPTYNRLDAAKVQLGKVWTQIADRFKNYDNQLVFETLNEPRLKDSVGEWTGGTAEGRDCVNQYHQVAVAAIRAAGGNNGDRYIMVSPYAASSSQMTIDALILPSSSHLIVSVHNYFPYKFALAETAYNTTWGTAAEKQALDAELDRVVIKFINNGIPVVMGEWGNINHDNIESRILHAQYYTKGCVDRGICPVWWDNGNDKHFGIIDRNSYQWVFPGIADAIIKANIR